MFAAVVIYFLTAFAILSTRVADSVESALDFCPKNCTCNVTDLGYDLRIDCVNRKVVIRARTIDDSLAKEINFLIITLKDLKSLSINNCAGLTNVLSGICNAVHLKTLNLDRNGLRKLPDDCLVRLSSLESLSANFNSITYLQVGFLISLQEFLTYPISIISNSNLAV